MRYRNRLIPTLLLAAALLTGSPVSAAPSTSAAAPESLTSSTAPSLINARVRVVKVYANKVMLDVFDTDAQATGPAAVALGHRSTFSTQGATLNGKPWSSAWRSIRKDSMLMVQASVTPKTSSCAPDPDILGDKFCRDITGGVSALSKYMDLRLISASITDGYCASGPRYGLGVYGWTRIKLVTISPQICFFDKAGVPTAAAYLSQHKDFLLGKTRILLETKDKSLTLSLPATPGTIVEMKVDRLPPRRSKIRVAIAADFKDDGDDVETSGYKSVTLPR